MLNFITNDKQLTEWQEQGEFMQKNKRLLSKIRQNQQKKTLTYMQSIQKKKTRPMSSPAKSIEVNASMNQLRNITSTQKIKAQKIRNRLSYLNVAVSRKQKLVNSAKQKFYKITQIRRQSFTDKSLFSKQRQNLIKQHSRTVYLQASKVKSQRHKSAQSQQLIMSANKSKAQQVKMQRTINQKIIKQQQSELLWSRGAKASEVKQYHKVARQRSEIRQKQKVEKGKVNHKRDILEQYEKVQKQLKVNSRLMKGFVEKAGKVFEKKNRQEKQLEELRAYLGLNKSQLNDRRGQAMNANIRKGLSTSQRNTVNSSVNKSYISSAHRKSQNQTPNNFYLTNPQHNQ